MTEANGNGWMRDGWKGANGFTETILPHYLPLPPDGCMRITVEGGQVAGDAVATAGDYVSVLLDSHVHFDTPAHDPELTTTRCNLVLDESAVIPLIAVLGMAGGTQELMEALWESWGSPWSPAPGRHSGPSEQVDWAVPNGASGRRPLALPPLSSGQSRLVLMEPEFDIVGDARLISGGWVSVTALRPFWTAESGVPVQLEEVNLCLSSAGPLIALLLHAVGQPELAAIADPHMGRANQVEPQEPPEANERDLGQRLLEALQEARDQGNLRPRNEAGQEPERDEAPPPNTPVDADRSDRVIGIAELVDAVMELTHHTHNDRRRDYLTERVKIIAMELGAVHDLGLFPALLSPTAFSDDYFGSPIPPLFKALVLPGLEAPKELAEPYWEVQERAASLAQAMWKLRDEILDLRREWLTSTLLNIEPALEYRTTTEARLQARGLPSRP